MAAAKKNTYNESFQLFHRFRVVDFELELCALERLDRQLHCDKSRLYTWYSTAQAVFSSLPLAVLEKDWEAIVNRKS